MTTPRLTVAQALVRFLAAQHVERDGASRPFFAGCFGIFGHGNLAGIGEALQTFPDLPYHQARNEQAMVHTAVAYARAQDRLSAFACTSSIGPGATNMVTGAALATINRLPVLLLPGDSFARRTASPLLQELELPASGDITVNDALRPVSAFFDRVDRPEQLPSALLGAMRILTDPATVGAATIALPQDVQAEAADWDDDLFAPRTWHIARPQPEPDLLAHAAEAIRRAERPLIVAGGGVIYSGAHDALATFARRHGIPVAETQAGKGSLHYDHPCAVGAIGATGTPIANELARTADLIIGIGSRFSDFTTASRTIFAREDVRIVAINVARFDAVKLSALPVVADALVALTELDRALGDHATSAAYQQQASDGARAWDATVDAAYMTRHEPLPAQSEVIGAVNTATGPRDVVVCAAGSMPGDLHKLWRTRDAKGYHVEYGYSCMGYEIAGGLGVAMADPSRRVVVMVGDGSYLMMHTELVTAVAEGIGLTVVVVQNYGFGSIGALSESLGSQRFGTSYRHRDSEAGTFTGDRVEIDIAANAASLGAHASTVRTIDELSAALTASFASLGEVHVIVIETDPMLRAPDSEAWWEVTVAQVSDLQTVREARAGYDLAIRSQRSGLRPFDAS